MATEAQPPLEGQLHAAANPDAPADSAQKPPVKRSWRRKYRKMRAKFEDTMNTSNTLIMDEWRAMALARRLQEQNDQIMDLLLDMNEATRLPTRFRFDLREFTDADPAEPPVEANSDPEAISQKLQELRDQLSNEAITPDEYAQKADQLHSVPPVSTIRTLANLEAKVPHTSEPPDPPIEGIDVSEHAPGYMSPAHEEEYLLAMDVAMADPALYDPSTHDGRPLRITPPQPLPTEKDLTVRNPDSVYNWLRKHQPQVFLQDKDPHNPENLSEKSAARAGNTGGRGKRQSAVSGTPGPKTDHDDDDAFIPETGTTGAKGKRGKRDGGGDDDSAYRPKGGNSRGAKRKREDGDPVAKGGRKKNRVSAGNAG